MSCTAQKIAERVIRDHKKTGERVVMDLSRDDARTAIEARKLLAGKGKADWKLSRSWPLGTTRPTADTMQRCVFSPPGMDAPDHQGMFSKDELYTAYQVLIAKEARRLGHKIANPGGRPPLGNINEYLEQFREAVQDTDSERKAAAKLVAENPDIPWSADRIRRTLGRKNNPP